jgi:hypothetical protein
MAYLRRTVADIWAGLRSGPRACRDLLLWGHVHPSHYPVRVPPAPPISQEPRP